MQLRIQTDKLLRLYGSIDLTKQQAATYSL